MDKTSKVANLVAMMPMVAQWGDFMKAEGINVHSSFLLVRYKAEFMNSQSESLSKALQEMLPHGLSAVLDSLSVREASSVHGWLRSTIFFKLSAMIECM